MIANSLMLSFVIVYVETGHTKYSNKLVLSCLVYLL